MAHDYPQEERNKVTATGKKQKSWKMPLLKAIQKAGALKHGDMHPGKATNLRRFIEDAATEDNVLYFMMGSRPSEQARVRDIVAMAEESGLKYFTYKRMGSSIVFASKSDERMDAICSFVLDIP